MHHKEKEPYYWYDPAFKITHDNVKSFFFDMKCSYQAMDPKYPDFKALNIPDDTIKQWTNEYFTLDIKYYETLKLEKQCSYIHFNILDFGDVLNQELVIRYYTDFMILIKNIENPMDYIKAFLKYYTVEDISFFGFIEALLRINQIELMNQAITMMIDIIKKNQTASMKYNPYTYFAKGLSLFHKSIISI